MTHLKLRYVDTYVDVTGKRRYYFRRTRSTPRIALPGVPGGAAFLAAYQEALEGERAFVPKERGGPGTFNRLIQLYFESTSFLSLAPSSQRAYQRVIERWVRDENIGQRRVDQMKREHVDKMLARRAATPGASNDLLKKIRVLMGFAIQHGWRRDDPTIRMRKFAKGPGHHTWTDDEIARFECRWPPGSKERLAFGLLLFTGQRLSDVIRMSWPDIEDGTIRVAQQKTKERLWIPLHPELKALLAGWSRNHVVILATAYGKPFTSAGFGGWMADKIAAAGLSDECVTHGLRKAAARRLAEAGCTTLQIMAVTGHRSISEVERYTREAEQKRLAREAMKRLSDGSGTKSP